mgnify:CR=1 FL=1
MSFLNPDTNTNQLERNLLRIMRIFLLVAGVYITLFGGVNGSERIFGVMILVALTIINAPAIFTGNRIRALPVEIELLLLAMVLFELVGGDALGLYVKLPYYDNIPWESIEVIDENTIEIKLTQQFMPLYNYLSLRSFSMYNPEFVESHTEEDLKNQVNGTGPFMAGRETLSGCY